MHHKDNNGNKCNFRKTLEWNLGTFLSLSASMSVRVRVRVRLSLSLIPHSLIRILPLPTVTMVTCRFRGRCEVLI